MHLRNDFLLKFAASALALLFLRDGYAGLRGREMWIQGAVGSVVVLRKWKARLMGGLLVVVGLFLVLVAWLGAVW